MRSEAKGFITHAALMLQNAYQHIKEEWDNPDVVLTPAQTADMRRSLNECRRLLKDIDQVADGFEKVAEARMPVAV